MRTYLRPSVLPAKSLLYITGATESSLFELQHVVRETTAARKHEDEKIYYTYYTADPGGSPV
jgi:hypothetical protein